MINWLRPSNSSASVRLPCGVSHVLLLDLHPGQRAPLGGNKIAHARERLLAFEMCLARRKPFVLGHDSIVLHCSDSIVGDSSVETRAPASRFHNPKLDKVRLIST